MIGFSAALHRRAMAAGLAALCLQVNARAGPRIELPFDLVHGVVIVHATMQGRGPYAMMLDSGADPSIVDLQTARAAGLTVAAKGGQGSGGGSDVNLAYPTRIASLELGDLHARHLDALAMNLSGVSKALGVPLHGVLGRSLMKGRIVQIDYPGRVVRFLVDSAHAGKASQGEASGGTTLHYRYRDDILMQGVKVNGKPVLANLDTGASSAFQIAPGAVKRLGLEDDVQRAQPDRSTGFNGSAENRIGQVDSIDVGAIAVSHPAVVFDGPGTGRDDVGWSVRVGGGFLQDYVVTIDDRHHTVRLARP